MNKKLFSTILLVLMLVALVSTPILAAYPDKSLNYIVCFNPGGESDLTARAQQKPLEDVLGVDVVVSYKIGGGGAVRIIWGNGRAFPSTNTGNV
jgi:tripartite-type tricarboxylate transporter receptor subunit TctC